MTTTPDPMIVREIAREIILDCGRNADDIGTYVWVRVGADLSKHEHGAWCSAIREAIRTAQIAMSWPDEQPQDERDAESHSAAERVRATLDRHAARGSIGGEYLDADVRAVLDNREMWRNLALSRGAERDERDAALADLATELDAANANAAEIADQRTAYREEVMRLRARVRELEREVRQLRAGAPRAWTQDLRSPVGRFENFINATRSYDSDHLGGIMRGGNAEATITLGDLRAVLARLAELEAHPWQVLHADQDERDGDVRAVARLLASADGSITEMFAAHEALEARFADRIAAIERDAETETAVHGLLADLGQRARDTKAGNQ